MVRTTPAGSAEEPDAELDENDVAMLVYTSGTEAFPKGVMIPHRNYLASAAPAWGWGLDTGPGDTWLFVMPFFTIAGLGSMTTLTLMGATLVLPNTVDPSRALQMTYREGVTVMAQTPTFYLQMCRLPEFGSAAVGTLRRCMTYGGTVPRAMTDAWREALSSTVWGTYWGQSELSQLGSVGWFSTLDDIPDSDPTWIGKPVTHLEIHVVDEQGNDAEVGELICRSPSVMLGYYKEPERTAEVFRDGWVHTGDVVRIDEHSNLFFVDRRKDIIKTGGMNVSSQEVERVLNAHPEVLQAAVVGLADEYWTEAVTAFAIPIEGASPAADELIAHCKRDLAPYKVPKALHLVDELPRDAQGKILKRELRNTVGRGQGFVTESATALDADPRCSTRSCEILAAATELFAEHGYQAVGMRAIAEAVGIRTSSLYHHFASKSEILYAIALAVTRDFVDSHLPLLDEPGPAADRLGALVHAHIVYFWQHRLEEAVGLRELRHLEPDQFAQVRSHRRRYQDWICQLITDGAAAGEFRVADPRLATLALLDMINGVNQWFSSDGQCSIDDLARHHADLVVGHLLR